MPSLGIASSAFTIPNSLSLISTVIYQQVAPVEFGADVSITALTRDQQQHVAARDRRVRVF